MNQTHYPFQYAHEERIFQFTSVGKHGRIKKIVRFRLIYEDVYNLGFADLDERTGRIDDTVVTDNGDMRIVLATIVAITYRFFSENPTIKVFLTGSSPSRTRLYQIIISINFEEISKEFLIYGFRDGEWYEFGANENYESFLIIKLL